jgi:putative transposase
MTMPRQILPNKTYIISRRCTQRQFLLKPSPLLNAVFLYCLAVAAEKYQVLVHCIDVLSNHYHATITDVLGNIPEFMAYLHKLVAKCVNASLGRWENVWSVEQPSLVRLEDDQDVLRKMVYTMANPVSSFLVPYGDQWPGLRTRPADLLKGETEVPRPSVFFREEGTMPKVAKLRLTRPDVFPELSDEEFVELLEQAVEEREAEIREQARKEGKRFLGLRRLRRQRHTDTPQSREPRRKLKPRVAAVNKWRRIESLQRLKEFIVAYREAWLRWKQGFADVVFPAGTYALAKHAQVVCAPP